MRSFFVFLSTGCLFLAGCQREDSPTAWVRLLHLNTEYPASVDVRADGKLAFVGIAFGDGTPYQSFPADATFQAFPEGRTGPMLFSAHPPMEPEHRYSILFLSGLPGQVLVLADDTTAPPSGGAYVRFVHAAVRVPQLVITDIPLSGGGGGQPRVSADGEMRIWLRRPGQTTGYRAFPAGDVVLYLSPDGLRSTGSARLSLRAGSLYTVAITGSGSTQDGIPLRFRAYEHLLIP
jgi:hypothetical protein|nr:MAG: hypothetical protein KatS3mg041_0036 [Bacteroidota bacterium]